MAEHHQFAPNPPGRFRARERLLSTAARVTMLLCAAVSPLSVGGAQNDADRRGNGDPAGRRAPPVVTASRVAGRVHLDGVLSEAAWLESDSSLRLTQVEPRRGEAPSARTEIRLLVTPDAILVGVRADYPARVPIVGFARDRDASLSNEDHVTIVLDTYLDGRSGYLFAVNPNGARYDALVTGQGSEEDSNWDGVWEAATRRDAAGWSAEIRIPVRSLLFRPGLTEWGFNVERRLQALQETDRWSGASRDYKVTQTARAGRISGLPPFRLGLGLSVRPAITTGTGFPGPDSGLATRRDLSLDVTQRMGANTLASLTVNTDFAETDVDTRRTNLTRFSLFFPEKRTFFLEGADIFDFGVDLNDDLRPFYSRTIGLLGGARVPLDAGAKLNGRARGTNFGALVARTGAAGDSLDTPATTMGVVRLRQNVLGESSIGMLAAFGDPAGIAHSWTGGADATYHTSRFRGDKNLTMGAWFLATDRDSLGGDRQAVGATIDYPNDLWEATLSYKRIGDGFQPSLGFVPRRGVQIFRLSTTYQPRPTRPIGPLHVRQMFNEFMPSLVTDLAGHWESYRIFWAPVNWRLESGDRFEFNVVPQGERLVEPFEISDGVTIAPGAYAFPRFRLEGGLASKRTFSGQYTWWFGRFYDGVLDQLQLTSSWKPSPLVIVELSGEEDIARLPTRSFTKRLVGVRLRLNASSNLQFNNYVQYDSDSRSLGSNSRLRWTFSPLGDLFVVYNHNLARTLATSPFEQHWAFASNQLLAKLQYAFRY